MLTPFAACASTKAADMRIPPAVSVRLPAPTTPRATGDNTSQDALRSVGHQAVAAARDGHETGAGGAQAAPQAGDAYLHRMAVGSVDPV